MIGFKFENNKLVIEHWEISSIYRSSEYIVEAVVKKFGRDRIEAIKNYISGILGLNHEQVSEIEYRKICYSVFFARFTEKSRGDVKG